VALPAPSPRDYGPAEPPSRDARGGGRTWVSPEPMHGDPTRTPEFLREVQEATAKANKSKGKRYRR
jgi:hypothetical protein